MIIKTGIRRFDEIVRGGLVSNRTYVVSGPPGSGKTTFGAQFLANGASAGPAGLYVSLVRGAETTVENLNSYSMNIPILIERNRLFFIDVPSVAGYGDSEAHIDPSVIYSEIADFVNVHSIKRLVIDPMSALRFSIRDPGLMESEVGRFIQHLKLLDCTTILLSEMVDPSTYSTEQYACDGLIFLHNFMRGGSMVRAIQVTKMCGTAHDCKMRKLDFGGEGLFVGGEIA